MINTVDRLLQKAGFQPNWIIELGSGFDSILSSIPRKDNILFSELPDMQIPTTPGHTGVVSFLDGLNGGAFMFFGRSHLYEGIAPQSIASIVRIAKLLKVEGILFCSACGGIDNNLKTGDIVLFKDLIRFPQFKPAEIPVLIQPDPSISFTKTSNWFDIDLSNQIISAARYAGIHMRNGVIALVSGPNYETKSEVTALRKLGAAAVTMSCEPALRLACKLGVKTAMLGGITNPAAGVISDQPLRHEDVLKVAEESLVPKFRGLIFNLAGIKNLM